MPLFDFVLLTVSVLSAAAVATIVWANGAGGILFPMLIGVAASLICLVSAFRAGGTKNIVSAYAQRKLDTGRFLKRVDTRARASLHFRAAVICLAPTALACVIAAAFPGRIVTAPITAALLTVVMMRFVDATGYRTGGGWFFDALVPDEVVLDMTASADAWARFRAGWTLNGRVAVLRRAAALRPDLPQEVRQIVLAQYSPQAIFVPVRLQPKSVVSELRLMFAGGRAGGAAMALAAILALAAVTLLPRDLLRIPPLNELQLPGLQPPPEEAPQDPDKPDGGQGQSGNDSAADQSGASGGNGAASGEQDADGAFAGQDGGDPTSGQGEGDSGKGQGGQSPAGADRQGQVDQGGTQAGKDAAQQGGQGASDAAGGADGEKPGVDGGGPDQEPGAGQAADEGRAGGEVLDGGGQGQDGQSPEDADQRGQVGESGSQAGKDAAQQGKQGASDAAGGADGDKPGADEDGRDQEPGEGQTADERGDGAKSQDTGGGKGAPGDSAAGESDGPETKNSGDSAMSDGVPTGGDPSETERAGGGTSSPADTHAAAEPGRDADENQAGLSSDTMLEDDLDGEARDGTRERVDELPQGARIIQTGQPSDEVDQELLISPPLADATAETPTETVELREAAQPPQADVALELKAGGPAALFAEQGEVPEAVEARLLSDEPVPSPSQATTPAEARQILPAWIDELMK